MELQQYTFVVRLAGGACKFVRKAAAGPGAALAAVTADHPGRPIEAA